MQHSGNLFTVVIPTLNERSLFLEEALKCVDDQSVKPAEIIIVNNGIGTVSLPSLDVPTRVFDTVYLAGAAQARNFGVTLSSTEYVAFLDDDDLWAPDYLEKMQNRILSSRPDCLIGRLDQLVGNRVVPFKNAHGLINQDVLLRLNPGTTDSTMVLRRESFLSVGGCNARLILGYDKALILAFLKHGKSIETAPECQAILRQHSAGDRLTEPATMADKVAAFYREYRKEMNFSQRLVNIRKILRYRFLERSQRSPSGKKFGRSFLDGN